MQDKEPRKRVIIPSDLEITPATIHALLELISPKEPEPRIKVETGQAFIVSSRGRRIATGTEVRVRWDGDIVHAKQVTSCFQTPFETANVKIPKPFYSTRVAFAEMRARHAAKRINTMVQRSSK